MLTCHLCPPGRQDIPAEQILDHLRMRHPQVWDDGPPVWPNGQPIIVDCDLLGADHTEEA